MTKSTLYFGGMPTEPDVRKLIARFPPERLSDGDEISYDNIAEIIGEKTRSNRFNTITASWIKKLKGDPWGLTVRRNRAGAFRVLSGKEQLHYQKKKLKRNARGIVKSVRDASLIDPKKLTDSESRERDHFVKIGVLIRSTLADAQKKIAAPEKIEPNPRNPLSVVNNK